MTELHSFGGSALDRHVFDFETVADATPAGAPAGEVPSPTAPATDPVQGAGGEPDPSTGATETAPAWTPEQIAALRNDPEFQSFVSEEATTIAQAQFQHLLERANANQPATDGGGDPGGQVDLNQFLDPYGDNFGVNLASVLGNVVQHLERSLDQRFEPMNEQAAQVQAQEHDSILKTAITDTAQTLGGLKGGDAAVERVMNDVRSRYMPEAARVYGNTERAARVAIDKAIRAERDYQTAISGTANVEQNEHLATLAGARTDLNGPGSGSGLITLPDQPRSARERVAAYAPQLQSARTTP